MIKRTGIDVIECFTALLLVVMLSSACADVVTLNDGTCLQGDVKKTDKGWTILTSDGRTIEIAHDKVKSIQLGDDARSADPRRTAEDLASLRRSVENLSDLSVIIDRYARFIEQNKNTSAATEAQEELLIWQDRSRRDLVKLGGNWVTRQERSEVAKHAFATCQRARKLISDGRHRDATDLLTPLLQADPQCTAALYLRGMIEYQNKKLPEAREFFEAVVTLRADHAPSLNNIAVILWRQNAQGRALSYYDKSITAAPDDKSILDNVAIALAAASDGQRKNKIWESLHRKFTEQDARLQQLMAAHGWYRWGTAWIDEPAMQEIRDKQKEIGDQVAAVVESVKNEREELRQVDERLAYVQQRIHRIFMNTPVPFRDGWMRMPFPPVYYELQEEEANLKFQRAGLVPKVEAADAQAERLRSQLPQPSLGGTQKVIGIGGMPMITVDAGESTHPPLPTR